MLWENAQTNPCAANCQPSMKPFGKDSSKMEAEPLHTSIDKSIQTFLGLVVLESPKGFPRDESNLYCVSPDGKILWKAQKPDPNTLYSRVRLTDDGQTLSAYTIGGHACDLDLKTGTLISQTIIQ